MPNPTQPDSFILIPGRTGRTGRTGRPGTTLNEGKFATGMPNSKSFDVELERA